MSSENSKKEIWVTEFTPSEAQKFRDAVMSQAAVDPTLPIVIYIDSYGGYVDSLAKMIATLDEIPNPVVTVCMGKAMSCGAMLLSHGDIRFCDPHSRVMIHEVSAATSGDVHDMKTDVMETGRLNEYFMGLLAKNCGYKDYAEIRKLIKEQNGRDRYLSAEDAVKFGIVDTIGLPKVSAHTTYEVTYLPPQATPSKKSTKKTLKLKARKSDTKK